MIASKINRRLLVSIHDVTPAHEQPVQQLWAQLRERGVTPALFVVPNWHGQWPLARHTRFVEWPQQCQADGADLFLHGERHDEMGLARRMRDQWRAFGQTAAEGEFLSLDPWQARERIERGVLLMWSLGLKPIGFVPPAWLARLTTHDVVRDVGLPLSEDVRRVYLHHARTSRIVAAPALRWSGRTAFRARASRTVGRMRWFTTRQAPVVRLALHPQDLAHPTTAHAVRDAIASWPTARTVRHYRDLYHLA